MVPRRVTGVIQDCRMVVVVVDRGADGRCFIGIVGVDPGQTSACIASGPTEEFVSSVMLSPVESPSCLAGLFVRGLDRSHLLGRGVPGRVAAMSLWRPVRRSLAA